jgi:hypothetical protein
MQQQQQRLFFVLFFFSYFLSLFTLRLGGCPNRNQTVFYNILKPANFFSNVPPSLHTHRHHRMGESLKLNTVSLFHHHFIVYGHIHKPNDEQENKT